MNFILNILIILIILCLLVLVHEFGHFIVAKLTGMYVAEFSLGMGPLLFKIQKGETQYSIRALPIGGYVNILGEEIEETDETSVVTDSEGNKLNPKTDPRSFKNKSRWAQLAVLIAGVSMNMILAAFLYYIVLFMTGFYLQLPKEIAQLPPWFGDIQCYKESVYCDFQYNGIERVFSGFLHVLNELQFMGYAIPKFIREAFRVGDYKSIAAGSVSSPVGMYFLIDVIKERGILYLVDITAMMSISLAFMNILPIPALDGGRVMLVFLEKILGKDLKPELEAKLIQYSFYGLLIFMLLVFVKDIFFINFFKTMFV